MSMGVDGSHGPEDGGGASAHDRHQQDLDAEEDDERRQIERHRAEPDRWDQAPERVKDGIGESAEEVVDAGQGAPTRDREPGQEDPGDEDEDVDLKDPAEYAHGRTVKRTGRVRGAAAPRPKPPRSSG